MFERDQLPSSMIKPRNVCTHILTIDEDGIRDAETSSGFVSTTSRLTIINQVCAFYRTIMKQEGCGQDFVARWKERFGRERLAGLYARHRGKIVSENIIRQEAKILNATKQPPPEGSTHWSSRKLARHLGVSHSRVARVWARAGIQPHRLRRYMASTDPEFEEKAADIIGLYLKPPLNPAGS